MDKYQEYFNQAAARFRQTGAGGVSLPNPDLTRNPVDPIKTDPSRQIILKNDWVMVGGRNVKNAKPRMSGIQILAASAKIIDAERKANAAKKNNKDN
jgi:hypothetical protein